ncbi:MAG: glutamine--fructose-6-phosphate transaminase (isomerizing) [Alphaproteobacteria bacterium]|nr:glutamine--fructose-6-phosphate transaminase (isomerizing) [Alphaproteobacteria bacterium]
MCGIVGYIGNSDVVEILVNGLNTLKYRGYDSAGIALFDENKIKIYKAVGKLENLKDKLSTVKSEIKNPFMGIGHIRWATHGKANEVNAHPHTSTTSDIVIVHNGIIENFKELREELIKKGCVFKSETDTEVVAHLISEEYKNTKNLKEAVKNALPQLKGAYALCIMSINEPDNIVCVRKNAPLIIGVGENENIIASDIPAIISLTSNIIYLNDDEIAVVKKDSVSIENLDGTIIPCKIRKMSVETDAISKMGYKHYMLKEIHEQPNIVRNLLNGRIIDVNSSVELPEIKISKDTLKNLSKVQIIACGTSLHAGQIGKYLIEDFAGVSVEVEPASEYIYRKNTTDENSLVIAISQSGETADTITAVKQAKEKGAYIVVITNRPDSNITRYADSVLNVNAGIEVSVAATKSYTAQLLTLYLFAIYLAEIKGENLDKLSDLKRELLSIPTKMEEILTTEGDIEKKSEQLSKYKNFVYIGRGVNLPTAMEGALKLKEISYINANAYPAGELKHGPIALLDENMPVVSVLIPGHISYDKTISNCEEAKARNAKLITVTSSNDEKLSKLFDVIIKIPEVSDILSPLLSVIPFQLLAYHISNFLGKDVDQPRNLAKSVTVE